MVTVRTDLGDLRESARRTRFEQTGDITDTNVQDAIATLDGETLKNLAGSVSYANLATSAQGLNFARNAQTANYPVVNADKGKLLALGGNSLFTLTLNAATGYDANFATIVHNEDAGRGKVVAANGRTSFILWPHQTVLIFNDNNAWKFSPDVQPWIIPAGTNFNVDPVNGSDSATNDGLGAQGTSGAFLTIQHAFSVIQKNTAGFATTLNIQLPSTATITEQVTVAGSMPPGVTTINITGNSGSPTSVNWQAASGPACVLTDYQSITFNGIGFSGSGHAFVVGSQFSICDFINCDFGANGSGTNVGISENARANYLSGCSISGSCGVFLQSSDNASGAIGTTFTVTGTPNVGVLANAFAGGTVDMSGLAFTGGGTISGQRFMAQNAGFIINDGGVSWPVGLTAGSATLGGLADAGSTTFGGALVTKSVVGLGYGAGAGGTVSQATNKSTGVTLNAAAGSITMNSATLSATTVVSFTMTNSAVAATDVLVLNHNSGGTPGSYTLNAQAGAGVATINVRNNTAGNLAEAIVINFVVIKGAQS